MGHVEAFPRGVSGRKMISFMPEDIKTTIAETPKIRVVYSGYETPPKFIETRPMGKPTANITNALDYGLAEKEVEVL